MRQHGGGGCGECRAVSGHHHDAPFAVLVFLGSAPSRVSSSSAHSRGI